MAKSSKKSISKVEESTANKGKRLAEETIVKPCNARKKKRRNHDGVKLAGQDQAVEAEKTTRNGNIGDASCSYDSPRSSDSEEEQNLANKKGSSEAKPPVGDSSSDDSSSGEESDESIEFSSDDEEMSEGSDEEISEGIVQADFAFFDPKSDDFHGVKILFHSYLDDKQWDLSGFVDLILGQPTVGTVVKIEGSEDEGLFAVVSALNLARYKDHKCIGEVKDFLLKACKDKCIDKLKVLLGDQAQSVGLLVSQRVSNLPPPLLPPLYDSLFDEVLWATEDEPTEDLRRSFQFKTYLLITKFYKRKNADPKKKPIVDDDEAIIYVKPEDEIFKQLCTWSFEFPLCSQPAAANELKNYRAMGLVMAVKANKISTFREQLRSLVDDSSVN